MRKEEKVEIALGKRSYTIHIGNKIVEKNKLELKSLLENRRIAIITDRNIFDNQYENLRNQLSSLNLSAELFVIEPGEKTKSWTFLKKTLDWLIKKEIGRNDYVIAFGGGVIGDLVGLAASLLRRGVNLIQIPTTLLSQVDSSIGGKTAINSSDAKNVIGSFYQPKKVFCDISFLRSLENREFLSGYAEILKMALVFDEKFYNYLNQYFNEIKELKDDTLIKAIGTSLSLKARVVERDENETGERALLNFGHTFGHALESYFGYSEKLLHGEAVAVGMIMAAKLSVDLNFSSNGTVEKIVEHCKRVHLPIDLSQVSNVAINVDKMIQYMRQDKKVVGENINLILLEGVGKGFIKKSVDFKLIQRFLKETLS